MIPKIIWQTHEWEYEDLPHNFLRCTQTWKNLNPEWEYRYRSGINRAIDVKNFDRELYQYYMFADKVTQSDIWRYVVLYKYGGFYTDMDSFCKMPLNYSFKKYDTKKEIFCTKVFLLRHFEKKIAEPKMVENLHNSPIASIPNSSILKLVLENIKKEYSKYSVLDLYNNIEKLANTLSRNPAKELWLGIAFFQQVVLSNKEKACFEYSGDNHTEDVKKSFKSDFEVDYYGEKIFYSNLCKKMNWNDLL
jgi:mannosyltransferase OCH1-like enzyme